MKAARSNGDSQGDNQPEPEVEIIPPGEESRAETGSQTGPETGPNSRARPGAADDILDDLTDLANHPMTMPRITYGLYAIASVTGFPMLIGLILAYLGRGDAPQWQQSHYTFLIRTFWYAVVLVIVGFMTVWILGLGLMILWLLPLWTLIRAVRGWVLLENRRPVPHPQSWLFG